MSVAEELTVTVASADPTTLPALPSGLEFPLGALDIIIGNVPSGGAAVQVTVVLQNPVNTFRKLIGSNWEPFFPDATGTGATISPDGTTITLTLKDGGRGDGDGIENGTIVDPGAPATDPWFAPGCYGSTLGGSDFVYYGPQDTMGNVTAYWDPVLRVATSTGGVCDPMAGLSPLETMVRATDVAEALLKCQAVKPAYDYAGNLLEYGYPMPSDAWACSDVPDTP